MNLQEMVLADQARALNAHLRKTMDEVFVGECQTPTYYAKRKYGKWVIYNKEGWRIAWGLNEQEMKSYMKLLKEEN